MTSSYTARFFAGHADGSLRSARRILPMVRDLATPASVIDVGCGIGTWLRAWIELGVHDVVGVDGSYVDRSQLLIDPTRFREADLSLAGAPANVSAAISRKFDLAMSLEVAEHLPPSAAGPLIDMLCSLAPVVLFSAAIPYQGGTDHINERLASYWAQLFAEREYAVIDAIRGRVWHDREVEWWYRQNTLLFASAEALRGGEALRLARAQTHDGALDLIHPAHYRRVVRWAIAGGKGEGLDGALEAINQQVPSAVSPRA